MFNNTFNVTDIDSTDKTWYDHNSEYEGFGRMIFLIPIVLFGSFTVIAMLRYCNNKK